MASKATKNIHDESLVIEVEDSPAAAPRKSTRKHPCGVVEDDCTKLCEFPVGQSDTVTVSCADYATLEHDTFLNDIIIDFYLTYLFHNVLPSEFRNSVHMFSTMFYKRLLQTPKKDAKKVAAFETDPSLSAAEKRHLRVAGWTKNLDLFSKDVVVIPICENSHWYLVLVVKPGLVNSHEDSENRTIDSQEDLKEKTDAEETINSEKDPIERTDLQEDSEEKTSMAREFMDTTDNMTKDSMDTTDNMARDSMDTTDNSEKESAKPKGSPFLLVLDSLGGTKRSAVANTQDYLACEWRSRKCQGELQKMQTIHPEKPEQENWSDCGIFLLHYVEKIFQELDTFLSPDLPDLSNWFTSEEVGGKRAAIAVLIRKLTKEQVKRGDTPNFPSIKFKSESRTRKSTKLMDSASAEISRIMDVNENLHQKEVKSMKVTRSNSSKQVTTRSTKCSKTITTAFKESATGSSDLSEDFTFDPSIYYMPISSSNTASSTSLSVTTPSISSNTPSSSPYIAAASAAPSNAVAMSSTSSATITSTSSSTMSSKPTSAMTSTSSAADSDGNPSNSSASNFASGAKANFMEVWNANKDKLVIGDYARFDSTSTAKKDEKGKKKRLGLETFKSLQLTSNNDRNTSSINRSYVPEKYTDKK